WMEAAADERIGLARAAEMDRGGEFLPLIDVRLQSAVSGQRVLDVLLQVGGGKLDRVTREGAIVKAGKMAGTAGRDFMLMDAVIARDGEGAVGHLKHSEGTRCRSINLERIPRPFPAPVGAGEGVAVGLHLRQRGEKFRGE